jgi:hypothetical protein
VAPNQKGKRKLQLKERYVARVASLLVRSLVSVLLLVSRREKNEQEAVVSWRLHRVGA